MWCEAVGLLRSRGGEGKRERNTLIQNKTIRKIILDSLLHLQKKAEECNTNMLLACQILPGLQRVPQCTFLLLTREHWFSCPCTRGFILCLSLKTNLSLWTIFQWCNILESSFVVHHQKPKAPKRLSLVLQPHSGKCPAILPHTPTTVQTRESRNLL